MSYWILPKIGIPVLRTMVQRVTYLETCIDARKQRFKVYGKDINEIFHNKYTEEASAGPNITKPTMEMWSELAEYDEDFQSEFKKYFTTLLSRKQTRNYLMILTITMSMWN